MAQQKPEQPESREENERLRDRHRRRAGPPIFAGLILILLGVLLFLENQGIVASDVWWQYFLIGLGVIFLVDGLVRFGREKQRGSIWGRITAGLILIGIGIVFVIGLTNWWPMILVALGAAIVLTGLLRR
jgi:uncharacterized membrane protein HdeD (DUF308 family)